MGSLQTEIFTKVLPKMKTLEALTFDDGGSPLTDEPMTKTQQIWEFIKQHPSCNKRAVSDALPNIKTTDVSSYLASLVNRNRLERVRMDGEYWYTTPTDMPEYPKGAEFRVESIKRAQLARATKPAKPKKSEATTPVVSDAKAYVETLNVKQARELYTALKEVFSL